MEPVLRKVIPHKEALRFSHGNAEEEMPSIHLRHLPGPPGLSSRPDPSRVLRVALWSLVGRRGEARPGAASPPSSHPAGSRDSPPPETAEKLGRERQPWPLSASLATPRRRAIGTQPSELLPVRRPLSPGARAEWRRAAGFVRERPSTADSPAACSTFSATQTQPLAGA